MNREGQSTSELIARSARTNPSFVRRVLANLAAAGLVKGHRGPRGNELVRDPEEISLLDIYRAVEGGNRPNLGGGFHSPTRKCRITGGSIYSMLEYSFSKSERALERELSRTTLAEVIRAGKKGESREGRAAATPS